MSLPGTSPAYTLWRGPGFRGAEEGDKEGPGKGLDMGLDRRIERRKRANSLKEKKVRFRWWCYAIMPHCIPFRR